MSGRPTIRVVEIRNLLLTKQHASEILDVSVDFFEKHILREIRVVRRGKFTLVPIRELERWIAENETEMRDAA
jgi:hypothetical protein